MQANQLRLWLVSSYVLVESLRRLALKATAFAEATRGTIWRKLFKIGALVTVSVRRIRFAMASQVALTRRPSPAPIAPCTPFSTPAEVKNHPFQRRPQPARGRRCMSQHRVHRPSKTRYTGMVPLPATRTPGKLAM